MKKSLNIWGCILSACCVAACHQESAQGLEQVELSKLSDVTPWIEQTRKQASLMVSQMAEAQSPQSLLTEPVPEHMGTVFAEKNATQGNSAHMQSTKAERAAALNVRPSFSSVPNESIFDGGLLQQPLIPADLTQANQNDIRFVGTVTQGAQVKGLIQVGARLYPVQVGDMVGVGRWSVISLDEQMMRLKIANKAVVYEKN